METLGLSLLEPPYRVSSPAARRTPALGAIVVCDLRVGPVAATNLAAFIRRAPWCPVCAVIPARQVTVELLDLLDRLPAGCPKVVGESELVPIEPEAVFEAISRRPVPAIIDLAMYAARRLDRPDLTATLSACFGGTEPHMGSSRSTLSRRLRSIPPLTARDWEAISQLAAVFTSSTGSAERFALDHGLDPRTVRSWTTRYLNVTWEEARGFCGWEWVLESALRRWGYVFPSHVPKTGTAAGA